MASALRKALPSAVREIRSVPIPPSTRQQGPLTHSLGGPQAAPLPDLARLVRRSGLHRHVLCTHQVCQPGPADPDPGSTRCAGESVCPTRWVPRLPSMGRRLMGWTGREGRGEAGLAAGSRHGERGRAQAVEPAPERMTLQALHVSRTTTTIHLAETRLERFRAGRRSCSVVLESQPAMRRTKRGDARRGPPSGTSCSRPCRGTG